MRAMQDEDYMAMALALADDAARLGEVPIGAVVVKDDVVIAQAHNRREIDQDPAGHAEFLALRAASRELGTWRLSDCTIYVTLEPCLMCAGLMYQARIDRCVFGAYDPKAGAFGSLYQINADRRLNHRFEVEGGVCEESCARLLKDFFAIRREKAKSVKSRSGESMQPTGCN